MKPTNALYDLRAGDLLVGILGSNYSYMSQSDWPDEFVEYFVVLQDTTVEEFAGTGLDGVWLYHHKWDIFYHDQDQGFVLRVWFPSWKEERRRERL